VKVESKKTKLCPRHTTARFSDLDKLNLVKFTNGGLVKG